MKILHTSDWHLGKFLYRQKRYDEFEEFLNWLAGFIEHEKIDALIVAGDIFDTTTPGNLAQKLYYRFLAKVANGYCRNIVITAGNHDSPSFLNAPRQVLETLNVFVVAEPSEESRDEIIMLKDDSGEVEAIVCAVPYLRERDVRKSEPGENSKDKEQALIEDIKKHYQTVCQIANDKRTELEKTTGKSIPLIATGHLFAAGGKTSDGDGVRELYIGSLGHISASIFPDVVDYVALGHLHIPQNVGGNDNIRYSGSPLPLSFSEANQEKNVVVIEFNGKDKKSRIETVPVPVFQRLEKIKGTRDVIIASIKKLQEDKVSCWLEIEYTGKEIVPNLKEEVEELLEEGDITILRIINRQIIERVLSASNENETLDELDEKDVFIRCMNEHEIPEEQQEMLMGLYEEVLFKLANPEEKQE